jgi:hypothetical protein
MLAASLTLVGAVWHRGRKDAGLQGSGDPEILWTSGVSQFKWGGVVVL